MDPESVESMLRQELRSARLSRRPCPGPETLAAYLLGELEETRRDEVRTHIEICGECDLVLLRMKPFDDEEPRSSTAGETGGWSKSLWAWLRHPMPGYVLALLLAIPAVRSVFPTGRPAPAAQEQPGGMRTVRVLELDAVRGGGGRTDPVRWDGSDVVLVFQVPVQQGRTYEATIRASSRTLGPISLSAPAEDGSFHLLLERGILGSGEAGVLEVREGAAGTGRVFQFEIGPSDRSVR